MILMFTVPGTPVGSARPRVTRNGTYIPKRTKMYMNDIRKRYADRYHFDGPVFVEIYAFFPIPKSYSKKERELLREMNYAYTKKPDCDNLTKCVLDALNGIAYNDDSQVCYTLCLKEYAKPGEEPRIQVSICDMKGGRLDEH
jgi:Holliday junction resolvase RusA-like endonuclease